MLLLEAHDYKTVWPKQLLNITKECERIYYKLLDNEYDVPEDMFLIEQFATLLTNLLENHPELAQDFQEFLDHLRML